MLTPASLLFAIGLTSMSSPSVPTRLRCDWRVGDALISSHNDMRGALLRAGEKSIQILEIQWGANSQWELAPAYLKYLGEDGRVDEVDHRARCRLIFDDISDIRGVYMKFNSHRVWLERIQFGVTPWGSLGVFGFQGIGEDGKKVGKLADPLSAPACAWQNPTVNCVKDVIDPCSNSCTQNPPQCDCPGGQGDCDPQLSASCPDDGLCPVDKDCQIVGTECKCD